MYKHGIEIVAECMASEDSWPQLKRTSYWTKSGCFPDNLINLFGFEYKDLQILYEYQ